MKQGKEIRVFSKIILENTEIYINKNLVLSNLDNLDEITKSILDIKNDYENKWKSMNKINTSIILPIRLSINSVNFKLTNRFEDNLSDLDLISNYEIERLSSKEIVYKIIFNSTPDKFLKIMKNKNFNIDTSGEIWKLQ